MLTTAFLRDKEAPSEDLKWMHDGKTLKEQIEHFQSLCKPAVARYEALNNKVERVALAAELRGEHEAAELIRDSIGVMVGIYKHSVKASSLVCDSLLAAYGKHYRHAFYNAGLAREEFMAGDQAMRSREHGKWSGFWRNDCLTDIKQSAWVMTQLMGYLRCVGDGPHYYQWKRDFTYPVWEKDLFVLMNMENHETDDEIFKAMKKAWQD